MASKYKYKRRKAKRCNYGNRRSIKKILYAVVHYTGNDCDTDEGNANYFANNNVGASAHYFIDDDSVTQSVPDNHTAWSVGSTGLLDQGSPYRAKGAKYWGKCTNTNSLNFELCDTVKDGKHKLSEKTRANAVVFIAKKMHEHDIPISRLIRHFDVNGKLCPLYWVTDEDDWKKFKKEIQAKVNELKAPKTTTATKKVNYTVRIKVNTLNIRAKASADAKVVGGVHKGEIYTIVQEVTIGSKKWGKLKSGVGYINLSTRYVEKVK